MIPREILREIRRIEITTGRMVNDVFAGQYQSVFKGRGIEFYEVREYIPGDEIRFIDWNVTARTGRPFIKKFIEERELTVMIILDMSASSFFGSTTQFKSRLAAKISSVLALAAVKNNDKVGFIAFTDKIEKFIPPRKGLRHVLRIVREALCFKPQGSGTDINLALDYLNRVMTRRTVTFVISDFFAPDFKKTLSVANKRHDIVAVTVSDPAEGALPDAGLIKLFDPETKHEFLIDAGDEKIRRQYAVDNIARIKERTALFRSVKVDNIDVRTDIPYSQSLFKFFKARERRQR
jgi:uncharacterized protein (DUF58 family)